MKKPLCSLFVLSLLATIVSMSCANNDPVMLHQRPEFKALSQQEKIVWEEYIERSKHWSAVDYDFINSELKKTASDKPSPPPHANRFGFDPEQPTKWYATDDGKRIANIILSFQTPSGGWSKRTDMSQRPRKKAEAFGVEHEYIPTFDNNATTTQIRVLAKAFRATDEPNYANGVLKGLNLILQAQYPNGCWPQTYPLIGGYHDHATNNDNVMSNILFLLFDVSSENKLFNFVPEDVRQSVVSSLERGVDCVLKTQIVVNGQKQIWGAQHNAFSFESAPARKFEPISLASKESNKVLLFLMQLPNPSDEVKASIEGAVTWFKQNQISGYAWKNTQDDGTLTANPSAAPLWGRFCEIGSNKPIFGDRNGSIHYDVRKISKERRKGYGWYTTDPLEALTQYAEWRMD